MCVSLFVRGCSVNFGKAGLMLKPPLANISFSSMLHYILQTLASGFLYQFTVARPKEMQTDLPLLLQCDATEGAKLYEMPASLVAQTTSIMRAMART